MSYSNFLTNHPLDARAFRKRPSPPPACRPSLVVGIVLGIVFVAALTMLSLPKAQGALAPPDPVVIVKTDKGGSGSGVIISPSGKVLTAEHVVGDGAVQNVIYRGQTYSAQGIHAPEKNGLDEAYLIQFEPPQKPVPYWPVAKEMPRVGDVVCSHGYPWSSYYAMKLGQVTSIKDGMIDVNFWVIEGNSGGPLCNLKGEVIGLASTRGALPGTLPPELIEPRSTWIGLPTIHAALKGNPVERAARTKLYVFTSPHCAPCEQFKQDQRGPLGLMLETRGYDVEFVTRMAMGWDKPKIVRECEQATRQKVGSLPTFWRQTGTITQVNYTTPERLLRYCLPTESGPYRQTPTSIEDLFPPPAPPSQPNPETSEPDPEIDWTAVKIVVLRTNPELKGAARAALKGIQEQLGAPIRRRLAELTDGRADVQLVHGQTKPARFAAVEAAVGKPVDRVLVVALVRKSQDVSYIRGKLIEKLTGALGGYLDGKPIEVITERLHPADFAAVEAALVVPEDESAFDDAPWWLAGVLSVLSLVVGYLGSRWKR